MSLAYWWLLVILNIIQGFFLKEKFKLNLFDPPHFCFSIILSFQGFIKLATQNALLNPLRLKSYFLQIMGSTWVNTCWSGQDRCFVHVYLFSVLSIFCLPRSFLRSLDCYLDHNPFQISIIKHKNILGFLTKLVQFHILNVPCSKRLFSEPVSFWLICCTQHSHCSDGWTLEYFELNHSDNC